MLRAAAIAISVLTLSGSSSLVAADGPPERQPNAPDKETFKCVPARKGQRFSVDFRQAPVADFARVVSCAAGLNLMFSPPTLGKKTVTVFAPKPVGLRGLLHLFRATLDEHGLKMERRGGFQVIRRAGP